jgi:hypothetical protein
VQKSKYKSLARNFQHKIARKTISDHILEGNPLPGDLKEKAENIKNRLSDTEFENLLHEYNSDFVGAFAKVAVNFQLSGFEIMAPLNIPHPKFNGTTVKFTPSLLTFRKTKANTQKIGAIMFRYAKGLPVDKEAADFQTAFVFGLFSIAPFVQEAKPEDKLCLVLDAVSGNTYTAPDKPIYKFNEMKAVCGDIAEKWDKVKPPPGAIF